MYAVFKVHRRLAAVYVKTPKSCYLWISGSRLLCHIVSNAVPSAVQVLTVVFGMGTGVSPARIATGNSSALEG